MYKLFDNAIIALLRFLNLHNNNNEDKKFKIDYANVVT